MQQALDGKDVVIAKADKPLVRLVLLLETKAPRRPGRRRGQIRIGDDFDAVNGQITGLFEQAYQQTFDRA